MSETKIEMKLEEETKSLKKVCEKLEEVVKHQFDSGIEQIDTKEMSEVIDMWKDLCEAKEKIVKSCYYIYILKAMEKEEEEDEEYKKFMEKMRMSGDTEEDDMERRYYDNYRYKTTGRFAPRGRGSYMPRRGYVEPPYYHMMPMYDEYYPEHYRDMDKNTLGKMYYSGGNQTPSGNTSGQGGRPSNPSSDMSGNMDGSTRGYEEYQRGYSEGRAEGYNQGRNEGERSGRQNESRSERARRNYTETKEMNKGNSPEEKQRKMKELEAYTKELAEDVTAMIADASPEERSLLKQKMQVLMQKI